MQAHTSVSVDTIYFSQGVIFNSNIDTLIKDCAIESVNDTAFNKKHILALQKILNKELKTRVFKTIQVVTGASLILKEHNVVIDVMEWHFDSVSKVKKIENALSRLENGMIKHTIVPYTCKWSSRGRKIYVITYIPKVSTDCAINNIQKCIFQ